MIDLQVSRKQIDEIDSQIVKLFEERMKVAMRSPNIRWRPEKRYLTKNARNRS